MDGTPAAYDERNEVVPGLIAHQHLRYADIPERGIKINTCRHFRYGFADQPHPVTQAKERVHVSQFADSSGKVEGQKLRFSDKEIRKRGKVDTQLFGGDKLPPKGKRVFVTEGELDAMAVWQVLGGSWPVVSLPNGVRNAADVIDANLDKLERFDEIVLCFDMDKPGQDAVRACRDIPEPGKVRITKLPRKDACDMLSAGEDRQLRDLLFKSPPYTPAGIVSGEDVWDLMMAEVEPGIALPWAGLEDKLKGLRPKQMILMAAGTSSGKSYFCKQLALHCVRNGRRVGYVALEESVKQSAIGIHALNLGFHIDWFSSTASLPKAELRKSYEEIGGLLDFYDHWGSMEGDSLVNKIRWMAKSGCRVIFLDHITIAISGLESSDERQTIDRMMTRLRSLVEETSCTLVVVSHLKRSKDGSHEEGSRIRVSDLRGSHSLGQIPDTILAIERNQQHEDELIRNQPLIRVLKNRDVGLLGEAARFQYDTETHMMREIALDGSPFQEAESFDV